MKISEQLQAITRKLADEGKIVEAGWVSLRLTAIPADASEVQLGEMRMAFFAGAQHLFGSIMGMLEQGAEPTENDLKRMDAINAELNDFVEQLKLRAAKAGGVA